MKKKDVAIKNKFLFIYLIIVLHINNKIKMKRINKKILFLYLLTYISLIKSNTIYPDFYIKKDASYSVYSSNYYNTIYKNGYFTESNLILQSPKYGIYYEPDNSCKSLLIDEPLIYNSYDEISFFSYSQFIKSSSTQLLDNNSEEVNLYKNTVQGKKFLCECPFPLIQNDNYTLTYKIVIISNGNFNMRISNDENSDGEILFSYNLNNEFKEIEIIIKKKPNVLNTLIFNNILEVELTGDKFYFIFESTGNTILSNYKILLEDKSPTPTRTLNGILPCDHSNNVCLNNYICNGGICSSCHSSCIKCLTLEYNQCTLCNYLTPYSEFKDGICKIGYIDLTKFNNFNVNIQPINTGRLTFGFWTFISNLNNNDNNIFHIAIEDFIDISISFKDDNIDTYCIVHENLYKQFKLYTTITEFKLDIDNNFNDYITLNFPSSSNSDDNNISGHWFFVSCAMSYDHGLYYMKNVINGNSNSKIRTLPKEHIYFENDGTDIINYDNDIYYRRIYANNEKMKVSFNNFLNVKDTNIYIRNLIIFKEYLQQNFNYMYYNFYNISVNDYPEILYIIPFDELIKTNAKNYFKGKNPSLTIEDTFELTLANSFDPNIPPLNFINLNLNKPNENFNEIDTNPYNTHLINNSNSSVRYYYEENNPLKCNDNYYYDIESKTCEMTCVLHSLQYTHYPGISDKSGYCDYFCTNNMICDINLKTSNEGFCNLDINPNIFNLYYSCRNKNTNYYLQFSSFNNSQPIRIEKTNLHSYIIEYWYYPDIFLNYNIEKTMYEYETNYFFYANSIQGYITKTHEIFFKNLTSQNTVKILNYYKREWNKFSINVDYKDDKFYYFKIYVNNDISESVSLTKTSTDEYGQLREIIFCNNCVLNLQNIIWAHGFYKDLKIWNGSKGNYYSAYQFNSYYTIDDFLNINSIYYYYPLKNEYIQDNNICDLKRLNCIDLNNNDYDMFHLQKYNYASKFDIIENAYPSLGKFLISNDLQNEIINLDNLHTKLSNCVEGCSRCWTTEKCYDCYENYFLYNERCYKNTYFYFKSPMNGTTKKDVTITLSFPLDTNAITCTFWVKPFDFSSDKGILIKYSNNLDLIFIADQKDKFYGLNLRFISDLIANDKDFRVNLGKWTFIAIAYHYTRNETNEFFPQFLKFEINQKSYEINYDLLIGEVKFDKFTIPGTFYGLFYNLKYYLNFLIGTYGIETNIGIPESPFSIPNFYDKIYFPLGSTEKNCYLENYFDESTLLFSCVPDIKFLNPSNTPNNECSANCFQCNGDDSCFCSNKNHNSQMIIKNQNTHICKKFDFINFANSDPIVINNVGTAKVSKMFTLQFWMFAFNYKKGKFGGITFLWNGHNKMIVYKNDNLEDNNYIYKCIPFEKIGGETSRDDLNLNIIINKWNFLSCAVDFINMKMSINLITEIDKFSDKLNLTDYNYPDILLKDEYTTLSINDNTPFLDWGLLFFRHIKLWKNYYPNPEFISRIQLRRINLFPYLLNIFEPSFTKDTNEDFYGHFLVRDESYDETIPNLKNADTFRVIHNEYLGFNILDDYVYTTLVLCAEEEQFYDLITNTCLFFPTVSNKKDFYFSNIPVSYSGNYAMSFWIFLEDSGTLTSGIHVRWEKHLQISVLKTNDLEGLCFPQGYYSDNIPNTDINDKYAKSLNKARVQLNKNDESESGNWIFVICSVSNYMEKFYINGNNEYNLMENDIIKETLYTSESTKEIQNYYPFRYYHSNLTASASSSLKNSRLYIENCKNTRKIYFRIIELFRDYIPYYYNYKYMDLSLLKANEMPSLSFVCNFANYNNETKRVKFSVFYLNKRQNYTLKNYETTLNTYTSTTNELSANFVFLPLCSFLSEHKYDKESNSCKPILSKMRNPGSFESKGICNANIPTLFTGSLTSAKEIESYKLSFSCYSQYQLIDYKCIDESKIENSAIFINRCYNQPNFYIEFSSDNQNDIKKGYFIEFWFKIDNVFNKCNIPNNYLYYFYSKPHTLFFDPVSEIWYYEAIGSNLPTEINNINKYEWNKIVIETNLINKFVQIYVNFYIREPEMKENFENLNLMLEYISFCSSEINGKCIPNQASDFKISWGSAYYRNLRVWNSLSTSINSIQKYDRSEEIFSGLILYYPMTIDKITYNTIKNIASDKDDLIVTHSVSYNFDSNDDFSFFNYGINFDWNEESIVNYGYYVSTMKDNEVYSTKCHNYCKRCYSPLDTNCYQCFEGYFLTEQTCNLMTGYFLSTPAKNSQSYITFKLNDKEEIYISERQSYTISFFIKIKGIIESFNNEPKIILLKEDIFIVYQKSTSNLIFYINRKEAFIVENFSQFFGIWIHISIANYATKANFDVYPSMITFMVNKENIKKENSFIIQKQGIFLDQISLGYEISALFSSLRIYDTFIHGVFGKIKAGEENRESGILLNYDLYNFGSSIKCIEDTQLKIILEYNCEIDYNPYLDLDKECNDVNLYFDLSLQDSKKPCAACSNNCKTFCFNPNENQCNCDLTHGIFWLRENTILDNNNEIIDVKTYCENIKSIDFSILNDFSIIVPSSVTKESTLEFWFFIYFYESLSNFNKISIEWDLHNKIQIYNINDILQTECFPLYSIDDSSLYSESVPGNIENKKWVHLSCGTDLINKFYYFNEQEIELLTGENFFPNRNNYISKLKIYSSINNYNFGFIFLREIKLWQQYNFKYVKSKYISLLSLGKYNQDEKKSSGKYTGLISYIKAELDLNYYQEVIEGNYYILNSMGEDNEPGEYDKIYPYTNIVKRKEDVYIGYNIIKNDYKEIPICYEGSIYIENEEKCVNSDSGTLTDLKCEFLGDASNCISCTEDYPFLHLNENDELICTNNCPNHYYNNLYINQCRACYKTCLTCNNGEKNECISCVDGYYYVRSIKECISDCAEYGLSISKIEPNLCIDFEASAELITTLPVDLNNFNKIEANLIYVSSNEYSFDWRFDKEETMKLNNETEDFEFLYDSPFIDDHPINKLDPEIKKDFFELSKNYVFYLDIISSERFNVIITVKFIININKNPYGGIFTVIPTIGLYGTTTFIISALNWKDDSDVPLLYSFYYKEKDSNENHTLQSFSTEKEIISSFSSDFFQREVTEITLYLEIKDNYGAMTTEQTDIKIYSNLTNENYDISKELINYSIPPLYDTDVLYRRSELLKSLGLNMYKSIQPNERTIFESLTEDNLLIKNDPHCVYDYCNNGICELIDIHLVCYCDFQFLGKNCQVRRKAYYQLLDLYEDLFKKILGDINEEVNEKHLSSVHNLFFGGWQFLQKEMFFKESLNGFISLSFEKSKNLIIQNLDMYFDLFEFSFSHQILMINQDKILRKNLLGYEFRNISLDDDVVFDYFEIFEYLRNSLKEFINNLISTKEITNYEYDSVNFYLTIQKINNDFNEDKFFKKRKNEYKSHIKFMNCLNYYAINEWKNINYEVYMVFIEYYNFPYLFNSTIYSNNTSPLIEIFFLDSESFKNINLNCMNENNVIIYLPFNSYKFLDQLNSQKSLFDPNNYKSPSDPIFRDPIYIKKNGFVTDDTVEKRIKLYNRLYNFSCEYYHNNKFSTNGIEYSNLTNNFIEFKSNHLSEFTTFFIENNVTFGVSSRFFYLKKTQLFKYLPNYYTNYAFYFLIFFFFSYTVLIIIFSIYDHHILSKDLLLNFLKKEIVKGFVPYNKRKEEKINEIIPNDFQPGINVRIDNGKRNAEVDFNQLKENKETNRKKFLRENGYDDLIIDNENEYKGKRNKYLNDGQSSKRKIYDRMSNKFFDDNNSDKNDVNKINKYSSNFLSEKIEKNINLKDNDNDNDNLNDKIIPFRDISLTLKKFIIVNIKQRHKFVNPLINISIFNPRWKKLTILLTEINLISLFISIFLTNDASITDKTFFKCCLVSFLSYFISNVFIYFLVLIFQFSFKQRRQLYDLVLKREQLVILREYEKMKKCNIIFYIVGFIISISIWIFSFYCSLSFVAVWKIQKKAYLTCIILSLFFDFLLFEFLNELFIGLIYHLRKNHTLEFVGKCLNDIRNFRCLSP